MTLSSVHTNISHIKSQHPNICEQEECYLLLFRSPRVLRVARYPSTPLSTPNTTRCRPMKRLPSGVSYIRKSGVATACKQEVGYYFFFAPSFAAFSSLFSFFLWQLEHKSNSRKCIMSLLSHTAHLNSFASFLGVHFAQLPSSRYWPTSLLPQAHFFFTTSCFTMSNRDRYVVLLCDIYEQLFKLLCESKLFWSRRLFQFGRFGGGTDRGCVVVDVIVHLHCVVGIRRGNDVNSCFFLLLALVGGRRVDCGGHRVGGCRRNAQIN